MPKLVGNLAGATGDTIDPKDPPGWCLDASSGEPTTCTYLGGEWVPTTNNDSFVEAPGPGTDPSGAFGVFFVLALLIGIGGAIWRLTTARRMARDAGLSESDATAMALLSDDGLEATYLASSLRQPASNTPAPVTDARSSAERLTELQSLLDQGLISPDEHATRRAQILAEI